MDIPSAAKVLRGIELRYVLTVVLTNGGTMTVAELVEEIARQGFSIRGRPSKAVSDALRWEVGLGRAFRRGRNQYGPGVMPRSTEYRIRQRVAALREEAQLSREGGQFEDWLGDIA